ncbi:MAG: GNAT family N-acetyltransferase [Candidatus Lokiarchaeota archaeon]|nr:GNAT family N-acetyltransferase [Candidatus Lokiarchaeota archaeon]
MKKVPFGRIDVMLREYDLKRDPEKLVAHLFNTMDSWEENIQSVFEGDKWFQEPNQFRRRLVAEIEGELFATVTVERGLSPYGSHRFRLYSVVTAPQYQGSGLSQILLEYVREWIKTQGGTLILVETWESNIPARKFYEKLGFKEYGRLPKGLYKRNKNGYESEILLYLEIE